MNNKQIAKQMMQDYWDGDCQLVDDSRRKEFKIDGLTIRCGLTYTEVFAVSEKFRKARAHPNPIPQPRRITRRFSIRVFKQFLDDGEGENAMEYARLFDLGNLPVEVQALARSIG